MGKSTAIAIAIIIIASAVVGYIYFKDMINKDDVTYSNITISAELNGRKIITGYVLETMDGILEGNTSLSAEILTVKDGKIKIYTKNIGKQKFYKEYYEFNVSKETKRIKLDLKKIEDIKVHKTNTNPINVTISSKYAENIDICMKWSLAYIFVELENSTIEKKDGCYDTNINLENSEKTIQIKYNKYNPNPTENDFIDMILISNSSDEEIKTVKIK